MSPVPWPFPVFPPKPVEPDPQEFEDAPFWACE